MLDKIKSLLNLANTAPSGDNCQPWRFAVNGLRIDLYNDPIADTSYYNYLQRASLVSHGAVLENIAIAAPTLGLKPYFQLFPNPDNNDHVATIILKEIPKAEVELAQYLRSRATNRRQYTGDLLDDTKLASLQVAHEDLNNVSIFLTNSKVVIEQLSHVISLNDQLVFENRLLHDFLFEHIRWSDKEAEEYRDGLDIKTLELRPIEIIGFKLLKHWNLTNIVCKLGAGRAIAKNTRKLALSASAIGIVLSHGKPTSISSLEGGRLIQRVWLRATQLGLAFHPIIGISFLMQRVLEDQAAAMSVKHQDLIKGAVKIISAVCKEDDPRVIGIFRVGLAPPPSAKSFRKNIRTK